MIYGTRSRDASSPLTILVQPTLKQLRKESRERFLSGRKAETQYARQLRAVAKQIGEIVRGIAPDGIVGDVGPLIATLNRYADILAPWAQSVAWRMIVDVSKRDALAWTRHGQMIGQSLRQEIDGAPTGAAMKLALQERVKEITSLPREAAERLFNLTAEGIAGGRRAAEIAKDILQSGEVSKSRAMMLARTGVSTTATSLTKARAEYVGSSGYIWRTSRDGDVRPSHRAMEGKFVPWNDPPTLDGYKAHCGEFANCRCFPEPVLPEWRATA